MPKKLRRKLFILSVLCAALMAISAPSALSASVGGPFCYEAPLESGCPAYICCSEEGACWCE
jgi:hypothetical protein